LHVSFCDRPDKRIARRPASQGAIMSGSIFLARTETSVLETAGTIQVEIRRSGGFVGDVTILYGVTGDTAAEGADYTVGGTGSILMAAGLDSITVPITILDDALGEGTEVTTFALISATHHAAS
jgi:hypothetical protein